jgi:hypothetical protein
VVADACDIYDGGNVDSEYPNILDGGTYTEDVFDGGDAFITNPNSLDGSGAFVMDGGSAYFTILNYILLAGGNADTNVCSPSNNARQPCQV